MEVTARDLPPEGQLAVLRELESRYLGTVEVDEERALSVLAERVRLALYGSIGIVAAAASGLVTVQRDVGLELVIPGFISLAFAVMAAWDAHAHLEVLSHQRRSRKLTRYSEAVAKAFPEDPLCPPPSAEQLKKVDDELDTAKRIRTTTILSVAAATFGAIMLLSGVVMALNAADLETVPASDLPESQPEANQISPGQVTQAAPPPS